MRLSRLLIGGLAMVPGIAGAVGPCATTPFDPITCDGYVWTTEIRDTYQDLMSDYRDCSALTQPGPEIVFPLTCPYDGVVTVTIERTDCDLDLYLLDATCDGDQVCFDFDTSAGSGTAFQGRVDVLCLAGETYYVVVEAYDVGMNPGSCPRTGGYRYSDVTVGARCVEEGLGCLDGWDNDWDGLIDCDDSGCQCAEDCTAAGDEDGDGLANCQDPDCAGTPRCCDTDRDGYLRDDAACGGDDCADAQGAVHPGAVETADDGVDQDCSGGDLCWRDLDHDGFGTTATVSSPDLTCGNAVGESGTNTDCDDTSALAADRYPGHAEVVGDGIDQDCDAVDACYRDRDDDGFGLGAAAPGPSLDCVAASGWASVRGDCLDQGTGASSAYPGATEVCDGVDNDCDTLVDGLDPDVGAQQTVYPDGDGDGYGTTAGAILADGCNTPAGYAPQAGDCADANPARSPGVAEIPYDGVDQDCSGADLTDIDGDGSPGPTVDCDDLAPSIRPGAGEQVNGYDDNCDGAVDELTDAYDDDGDGFAEAGGDCDDTLSDVFPGATEFCNQLDEDCDGVLDDGTVCGDDDGDGYTEDEGDCSDGDADVSPGEAEFLGNGVDDDCDGVVDGQRDVDVDRDGYATFAGDCDDTDPGVGPSSPEVQNGVDDDCDGVVDDGTIVVDDDADGWSEVVGDCQDADATIYPSAPELLDGKDNDCDGLLDEVGAFGDADFDGWTPSQGDCDDADGLVYPGAPELADGVDQDCDGVVDEWADDADHDGAMASAGDCDDLNGWVGPGQRERCDGWDNDCNGTADDGLDCTVPGGGDGDAACGGCDAGGGAPGWLGLVVLAGLRRRRSAGKIPASVGIAVRIRRVLR